MKAKHSKLMALVLVLCFAATALLSGCGSSNNADKGTTEVTTQQSATTAGTETKPQEKITLKIFSPYGAAPEKKTETILKMEEMLNCEFEMMGALEDDYLPKLSILLAAGDMPDFFNVWWSEDIMKNGCAAFTVEEFEKYAPKSAGYLNSIMDGLGYDRQKTWERYYRNGKLVQVPQVWTGGQYPSGIIWRKDILDELGMAVPGTIDEYEKVFAAFKAKYPKKYPYAAPGKLLFQAFSAVFSGSLGFELTHWTQKDGKLVPGWTQPEIKKPLEVLQRWTKAGYINPEWVTMEEHDNRNNFVNGNTILIDWAGYYTMKCDEPYQQGSIQEETAKLNPSAKFEMGPIPTLDPNVKPAWYIWDPFHGGSSGFGKHLEKDPDKLHRVMEIVEQMSQDEETFLLSMRGIKDKHWAYNDKGFPRMLPDFGTYEAKYEIGVGQSWWATLPSTIEAKYGIDQDTRDTIEKYILAPGALYSKEKVTWHFDRDGGKPIYNDANEDLMKKYGTNLDTERDKVLMMIITGEKPVSEYDGFIERWNKNGGQEIEAAANKLFKDLY